MISNTPIGADQIANAMLTLHRYQTAKAPLQQRLVENEKWYRLRHWQTLRRQERQVEPVSGWLFNAIANKHASAMDNIPTPTVLPREQGGPGPCPNPFRHSARHIGAERLRAGLFLCVGQQAPGRHGDLRGVLGSRTPKRPGRCEHPENRPAEPVLGKRGIGYPAVQKHFPCGAAG